VYPRRLALLLPEVLLLARLFAALILGPNLAVAVVLLVVEAVRDGLLMHILRLEEAHSPVDVLQVSPQHCVKVPAELGHLLLVLDGGLDQSVDSLPKELGRLVFPSLLGPLLLLLMEALKVDCPPAHRAAHPRPLLAPRLDAPVAEGVLADQPAAGVVLIADGTLHDVSCCLL